jgi:methionine synthase I (cobalamin-dependent)
MKNDLSVQFDNLNKEIVSSINARNYARATLLDQARQKILHELTSSDIQEVDAEFFSVLEQSARENSKLIVMVEQDMQKISGETGRSIRAQQAYSRIF